MRRLLVAVSSFLGLIAAPLSAEAQEVRASNPTRTCESCKTLLELAVQNPKRNEESKRDIWRHPVETLSFFGVRPTMKVGEYAPGGDWYSHILAPYLGQQGHLTGLFFNPDSGAFSEKTQVGIKADAAKFGADIAAWAGMPVNHFSAFTLGAIPETEMGTYDRVLVIRMMHNLMRWNIADSEIKAMRSLLKPDGMIGIVQHRAKADAPYAISNGSRGYLREADIIKFMEVNGFELVAKSEVNANPKDTADWPEGVWTLPPTLTLKDKDRSRYEAIGESDRMTLLFRMRN